MLNKITNVSHFDKEFIAPYFSKTSDWTNTVKKVTKSNLSVVHNSYVASRNAVHLKISITCKEKFFGKIAWKEELWSK